VPNYAALQSMMGLQSPSNMTASDPYVAKRRAQIVSGDEDYAPSEMDQLSAQLNLGDQGVGVSRDMIRDSGMQALKQRLGMATAAAGAKAQGDIATERVKGEYGLKAAEATARAAEDRMQANQDSIAQRTQMQIDAANSRQVAGFGQANAAREDAQAFKAGEVSPTALGVIARERQHLADEIRKAEPNALFKMFGRTNPRQAELDTYDSALGAAKQIAAMGQGVSAEDGLSALGEDQLTPDEVGQVQKFLLLLQGR
jgi:hypothetical protein